jgi:hypothetical protein
VMLFADEMGRQFLPLDQPNSGTSATDERGGAVALSRHRPLSLAR